MSKPAITLLALCLAPGVGQAQGILESGRSYTVSLAEPNGQSLDVAEVTFTSNEDGTHSYELTWNDGPFTDQFLSMRPFKCLDGPSKQWCRVPYPYENRRSISEGELTDLEYDLLFVWKGQGEYGIDLWNGVYYVLSATDDGLTGEMHEMDMNMLAVPPDEGNLRPIGEFDIELADPGSHWLPRLTIE